ADPARFIAMLEEKVVIAPAFIFRIHLCTERLTSSLGDPVPMRAIIGKTVIRGQIVTAAKPPYRRFSLLLGDEKADMRMTGGYIGVVRLHHQGNTHRLEAPTGEFRSVSRGGGRHARAHHVREINPALFKYPAFGQHPGASTAALLANP